MKFFFTLFFVVTLPLLSFSNPANFNLKERNDKIVVVLNKNIADAEQKLKSVLKSSKEVTKAIDNIYVLNLSGLESSLERQSLTSKLSGEKNLVKHVTPVYHGSRSDISVVCADEFIVKLKNTFDKSRLDYLNELSGVEIIGKVGNEKGFYLKTKNAISKTALELCDLYYQSGLFEYCEPNYIYPDASTLCFNPNDTRFGGQWNLNNTGQTIKSSSSSNGDVNTFNGLAGCDMSLTKAWDYTLGSGSVQVAIFDTGIDSTHPDFAGNVLAGYDAVINAYGVPKDSISFGHGTNCAGIIGAVTNNNLGVAGIAGGCKIRSYKVFTSTGSTTTIIQARAFDTARVNGIHIISCSWDAEVNTTLTNAINSCATSGRGGLGAIIFFASGNEGRNAPAYPSYLSNVVSVGSSTPYDQLKAPCNGNQFRLGSNFGEDSNGDVDCVAPSIVPTVDIQSTGGDNDSSGTAGDYSMIFGGTSASCASAAGVAALVLSINTSQTRTQVIDNLLRGCDKIENVDYLSSKTYGKWAHYTGYGRLNAYNSVRLAAGVDITPPSVNHLNIESHSSTYPTLLTAEIIDNDGSSIDTSITKPKIFYRTNKSNAGWSSYDSSVYSSKSSNNFIFQIPGQGWETQVQYYFKVKDNSGNTTTFPLHAPDTTSVCYFSVANLASETQKVPSFSMPAAGTATSSNVTFSSFKILKTKVRLNVSHQANLVYKLILVSPNSNSSFNRKCIFANNGPFAFTTGISNATTVDSASQFWAAGSDPFTNGVYKPDYLYRGLNGLDAGGNWNILYINMYNIYSGTADSILITLYKSAGTSSSSARLDSQGDSILYFNSTENVDTLNFYLKNKGTSNLTVSGTSFTGTYAAKYSLISSLPGAIAPNDSGLFRVRCNPLAKSKKGNEIQNDNVENAVLNITTNDPSKPTFKVSLQSDNILPVELASFTSVINKNNLTLNWTTNSELNNKGFEIEKKHSGSQWNTIGFVEGKGSSNQISSYSFEERNLLTGKYNYRLKQIDFNGNYKYYFLTNEVNIGIPDNFALQQNYPNPFNPSTTINFDLPYDSKVRILLFDISGRLVKEILNSEINAGYNFVKFNGSDLASGVYFYSIQAYHNNHSFTDTKRMVLIK